MCLYWKPQQVKSTASSILPLSIRRHWRGHMRRSCRQQTEPEAWAPLEMTNMHKVVQPSPQHCSYGFFRTLQFPLAHFIPASLFLRAVHPRSPFKGHLVSPKHSAACQSSASGIQVIRWRFIVTPSESARRKRTLVPSSTPRREACHQADQRLGAMPAWLNLLAGVAAAGVKK